MPDKCGAIVSDHRGSVHDPQQPDQPQRGKAGVMDNEYSWMYQCPGCGIYYDRGRYGAGDHTLCVTYPKSTEDIIRDKWERVRPKVAHIVFAWDQYRCQNCGRVTNLTVDHIQPINKGGANNLDNLQTLCSSCNSSKGDRT